jgi:hypothetical protein
MALAARPRDLDEQLAEIDHELAHRGVTPGPYHCPATADIGSGSVRRSTSMTPGDISLGRRTIALTL